ncbi:malate synthase [Brevibacillus panacihumi W25]|uniref:Malate synthase n=2 Tax=Brevibacillus panacihumi TaxID=497735 RepID=V6M0D1_9BACL|nr:malate synthase [Brevibacillus panacihumi W25]
MIPTNPYPIVIDAEMMPGYEEILTPEALQFIGKLEQNFGDQRLELLAKREERQAQIDEGILPDFLPQTAAIREGDWTVAPLPADLLDRRVEITGPAGDRKMVINALNSGARLFMADFEDANSPTWINTIQGQINMKDAVRRTISYTSPEKKQYTLNEKTAVLKVRPRGLHMEEKHILLDGKPVSASFVDFGLYFYHNVQPLLAQGTAPYFYLPKLESHLEARLWNDAFVFAQEELNIPQGTIRATVLIETIMAAFEMDEILYELREHSSGLNCGRWDYIFSYIKKLRNQPAVILPDRSQVTMTVPFMKAYTTLAVKTCHKRMAPCIGGMAAQIPVKNDPVKNEEALAKVRADKEREAYDGHDGTWVAHPGLVKVAMEVFDRLMREPNQIWYKREDVQVSAADLLAVPAGEITEEGVRTNINVGIQYIEAWFRGAGAVPIRNLMEDAATAEISRAQVWQWIRHPKGVLPDGRKITIGLVRQWTSEEMHLMKQELGEERYQQGMFQVAGELFLKLVTEDTFEDFLTIPGYRYLA